MDPGNKTFFLQVRDPEEEVCDWLLNNVNENTFSAEMLRSWMKTDKREVPVPPEPQHYQFCSPNLGIEVFLKTTKKAKIRGRVNPFEEIGNGGFSTRETVKAANLDWMVNFMKPLDQQNQPLVNDDDHNGFCYSDIFGERDGFTEYIEWRKHSQKIRTKKLDLYFMGHYHESGRSYKITDPKNIDRFIKYVRKSNVKLHLLAVNLYMKKMSKKRYFISPNPSELTSELFFKHHTLSYCLLALSLLRPNGTFIVKIYKSEKLFTVGLLYLMYRCFEKIAIVKPTSSRPDHSERYLICKWMKPGAQTEIVRQHLYYVNMKLNDLDDTDLDVMQLVPYEVLKADTTFFSYIYEQNDMILQNILQCVDCIQRNLESRKIFLDPRKKDFKERCIQLWDIEGRQLPGRM